MSGQPTLFDLGDEPVQPAASAAPAAAPGLVDPDVDEPLFRVEVTRSKKRKRSVGAQLVGDTLRLAIPAWMSRAEEQHWVDEMSRRFRRRVSSDRIDLVERAAALARRYRLSRPDAIRWSDDMHSRWGSCTPSTRTVRISTRIAAFPDWVVDYVIVHELAHLDHPGHDQAFWNAVARYPRSERAIGYLIAKSGDTED
jgi:predicted metal-dependent hydrolase